MQKLFSVCFEVSGARFIDYYRAASARDARSCCLLDLEKAGVIPDYVTVGEPV